MASVPGGFSACWLQCPPPLQVLSRDIRTLHKRLGTSHQEGLYHVLLEGVDVSYDVEGEPGAVVVRGAVLGGTGGRVMMSRSEVTSHEGQDTTTA